MLFFRNGFYLMCKVKDLKRELQALGSPEVCVKDLIRFRLN
ncbi:MAG TPA: hypothetical protein VHQ46_06000 [Desulfobacteria bacterium]|nr:hypothetical protein [Desulfobacteria bacterium]